MLSLSRSRRTQAAHPRSTSTSKYDEVARLIAGGAPPVWLVQNLERLSMVISGLRKNDTGQPTRSAMRDRLGRIAQAATELEHALSDPASLTYLVRGGSVPPQDLFALCQHMIELRGRAELAAASIPARGGRGRAAGDPNHLDGSQFCALVIFHAWHRMRDNPPGSSSDSAWAAADAYWTVSGGKPLGQQGLDHWRRRFERARAVEGFFPEFVSRQLALRPLDLSVVRTERGESSADSVP